MSTKTETQKQVEAEQKAAEEQQERDVLGRVPAVDNTYSGAQEFDIDWENGTYPDMTDSERTKVAFAAIDEYRASIAAGNPLPLEYLVAKLSREFKGADIDRYDKAKEFVTAHGGRGYVGEGGIIMSQAPGKGSTEGKSKTPEETKTDAKSRHGHDPEAKEAVSKGGVQQS